ncbi:MAG: signal recognition particle-docking protein FtsY [Candidatus Binatia bacterium]
MANWFRRKKTSETEEAVLQREDLAGVSGVFVVDDATVGEPESESEEQRVEEETPAAKTMSVWRRGLARLRRVLTTPLGQLFRGRPVSEELFLELEEALLAADVGVQTTTILIEKLRDRCRREKPQESSALQTYLKEAMLEVLQKQTNPPLVGQDRPWVILMVGVNGVGKTTSIAKLASRFRREGKRVILVAADTFRAAAIEQIEVWASRLGVELIKHQSGASPAAVAFDGIHAALARKADVVIVDTAGRLHTKMPLMEELKKVHRVIARELPGAPHEVFLVLDAATGQNALHQAKAFQQAFPLTGVILTKMDGSAKGGMALAVVEGLGVPVRCIGLGEKEEDLQDFSAENFVEALFAPEEGEA